MSSAQRKRTRKPVAVAKRQGNSQLGEFVRPAVESYYAAIDAADLAWTIVALLDEANSSAARTAELRDKPELRAAERPPGRDVDISNTEAYLAYALTMALRDLRRNPDSSAVADFFSLDSATFRVPLAANQEATEMPTAAEFLDKMYAQTWRTKRTEQLARLAPRLLAQLGELGAVLTSRFHRLALGMDVLRLSVELEQASSGEYNRVSDALNRAVAEYNTYTRGPNSESRSPAAEDRALLAVDSAIKWHLHTVPFEQTTDVSAIDLAHARAIKFISKLQEMPGATVPTPAHTEITLSGDPAWLRQLVNSVVSDVAGANSVGEQLEELAPGALDQHKPERSMWTSVTALLRSGEFIEGRNASAEDARVPSADTFGGNGEQTMRFAPDMFAAYAAAAAAPRAQPKPTADDDDSNDSESTDDGYRRPDVFAANAGEDDQPRGYDESQQAEEEAGELDMESIDHGMEQLRIDAALRGTGYGLSTFGGRISKPSMKGTVHKGTSLGGNARRV